MTNEEILKKYLRSMRVNGLKKSTIDTQILILKQFKNANNKDFDKITKDDIEEYIDNLTDKLKSNTLNIRKSYIKKFFKWYGRPELMEHIKIKKPVITKKDSDMLNEDEVLKIIDSCLHLRDKTIVALLFDSAIRVSELLGLNIGDVVNTGNTWKITVDGKTGIRTISLINSAPLMTHYINEHPFKNQHKKPLFISLNHRNYLGRLSIWAVEDMLHQSAKRAGIEKNVTPHIFRASRLTQLGNLGLNEPTMKQWAGWTKDSSMPAVYIHMTNAEVNETVYALTKGKKPEKNRKPSKLLPKICPRCTTENHATNDYCTKCWISLSLNGIDKENQILELIKSGYGKLHGLNLEKMLESYQNFKVETQQLQQVYDVFNGNQYLRTETLRNQLEWSDDDILNILGYLASAELVSLGDLQNGIVKIDKQKYHSFLQVQRRYVAKTS